MTTKPKDPLTAAFEQALRSHAFHQAARDLLEADLPATADLLGLPQEEVMEEIYLHAGMDEPDLLFRVGRRRLIHVQFLDDEPSLTLGKLLVVRGAALLEYRSARLEQFVVILDHRNTSGLDHLQDAAGPDLTVVPMFDVPFDRLLGRPTWAPFAALPRPAGPDHGTAVALAEQVVRAVKRPDQERLLKAVQTLKELP
jgi:hypothetical protein